MSNSSEHILSNFNLALDTLRNNVLTMSSLTEKSLRDAITGLFSENDELCNLAIVEDEEIDQLEKEIDRLGVEILMRFQPLASDMRQVISAMRLSNNLERVADQAVSIAKKARKLTRPPSSEERAILEPMFHEALSLLLDSVSYYRDGDVASALALKARDKKVDEFNRQAADYLTQRITAEPARVTDFLNLLFIARHIERVGDHAKNIAEDAVYAASAEDIRHLPKT